VAPEEMHDVEWKNYPRDLFIYFFLCSDISGRELKFNLTVLEESLGLKAKVMVI